MNQNLIKQLKSIEVEVNAEWKKTTRDFLLSQIKAEGISEVKFERVPLIDRLKFIKFAWRPVGAFALSGLLFIGMFGLTTVAAQRAMPGDKMFVVKKMIEKTQDIFTADNARKVELASVFLGNRVNELQKAMMEETQLVSADRQAGKIILAVTEVNKQLDEVNSKIEKLKEDDQDNSAVVALMLNEKIQNYKQELKEVKKKVENQEVDNKIDQALTQVGEINNDILEVIVDKQQAGKLEIKQEELQNRLSQHIQDIENKVVEVEKALANNDSGQVDTLKKKAKEAKHKIEDAKKAIAKNEFKLVLTLAKDSNSILKMLYGDVYQIVKVKDEVKDSNEQGEIKGAEAVKQPEADEVNSIDQTRQENLEEDKSVSNDQLVKGENSEIDIDKEVQENNHQSADDNINNNEQVEEFSVGLK